MLKKDLEIKLLLVTKQRDALLVENERLKAAQTRAAKTPSDRRAQMLAARAQAMQTGAVVRV